MWDLSSKTDGMSDDVMMELFCGSSFPLLSQRTRRCCGSENFLIEAEVFLLERLYSYHTYVAGGVDRGTGAVLA